MTNEFVTQAEEAAQQARITLGVCLNNAEAAGERLDEARETLNRAVAYHLANRTSPGSDAGAIAAQKDEAKALLDLQRAQRFLEVARSNVEKVEAEHISAQRQAASDTIQAKSAELIELSAKADDVFTEYVNLVKRGATLDAALTQTARITLDAPATTKWRQTTAGRSKEILNALAAGNSDSTGPTGERNARTTFQYLSAWPLYTPSIPDGNFGPLRADAQEAI